MAPPPCSSRRSSAPREFTEKPVRVLGIAQASDYVALDQKDDITTFPRRADARQKAYKMAGLTPRDIQFAEVHDCFTIAEIIAIEDLGFVERAREALTRGRLHRPTANSRSTQAADSSRRAIPWAQPAWRRFVTGSDRSAERRRPAGSSGTPLGLAENLGGSGGHLRRDNSGGA